MKELRFSNGPLSILLVAALSLGAAACGDDSDDGDGAGASGGGGSGSSASGSGASGGQPADIPDFNGCTTSDYVDLSGASAERTVAIGEGGLVYSPKCAIVAAGQSVTFSGDLTGHPTAPGNADDAFAGDYTVSPIVETTSGTSVDFTFPSDGTYPYYCKVHSFGAGEGMAGVIHVK